MAFGRILIVQYSANLDGSAISGLMLADGLRAAGWETYVAFAHSGPVMERYRAGGHEVTVVPHKSWLRTSNAVRFARNAWREHRAARLFDPAIRSLCPDVIYVNTAVSLAGAIASRRHGIPCIWHLRELSADVGGEMRMPASMREIVRHVFRHLAARIVTNSQAVRDDIIGRAAGETVSIIPNAIDSDFFETSVDVAAARRSFGLPASGVVLGVPGTLRPMKGHPFFFEGIRPLIQEGYGLTIAVTGGMDTSYARQVRADTTRQGLAESIHFVGTVHDMPTFYRACDLVCIPSVAEPFGRTVIEAFASGVPIIATAVGGIPEIVDDGENGLLVAYGDTQALADGIRRLLGDALLRERLRSNALRKARAEYHASIYKERIHRIVEDTAGFSSQAAMAA